jgi:hypothetical protein
MTLACTIQQITEALLYLIIEYWPGRSRPAEASIVARCFGLRHLIAVGDRATPCNGCAPNGFLHQTARFPVATPSTQFQTRHRRGRIAGSPVCRAKTRQELLIEATARYRWRRTGLISRMLASDHPGARQAMHFAG